MSLVVDSSVAFKWFVDDEPHGAEATALLRAERSPLAPDILIAEVCNTAWRAVRQGRIGQAQAADIPRRLAPLFSTLAGAASLAARALEIAHAIDHPVYDCLYISLAEIEQTTLVTADARLIAKLAGSRWEPAAILLARYAPPR